MTAVKANRSHSRRTAPPGPHRFGAHLSIAGGMHKAIEKALQLRLDTVQVFVKNQRQWRAAPLKPDDLKRWFELLATPGFGPPLAHATYLMNLASSDKRLFARSRDAFALELRRCQTLRIPHLIAHPGSAVGSTAEEGITRVVRALDEIFDRDPKIETTVLLETTAGQGTSLGRTFEQLGEIIRGVREPQRVGVCIDTCHVFAAGYDIRKPAAYNAMIDLAAREIGLDRIRCWHFNDSKGKLGSRLDRHEHIGHGQIKNPGFRNILSDPRFHGIPMILETPKGTNDAGREWDALNLRRLRSLARPTHP